MTREHAKELLPIITAFANGEEIQVETFNKAGTWGRVEDPNFQADPSAYRIAPKSRKVWVNEYDNGDLGNTHKDKREADAENWRCNAIRVACHEIELPPLP